MASITTIQATDVIANSRADINTNFTNLNSDKIETSYLDTDTSLTANSDVKIPSQKAVKAYVDSGGNPNASEIVRGIVEEATDAEVTAGTATGGTGAKLFITPAKLASYIKPTVIRTYNLADSPATWTKPTGLTSVFVKVWGAGGSGGGSDGRGGGGGGGTYNELLIPASSLGATETVTVGAGGTASTNVVGKVGGNSSFGTLLVGYGGGGGSGNGSGTTAIGGGGGGGIRSVGGNATTANGANGGSPIAGVGGAGVGTASNFGGGAGGGSSSVGSESVYGGGGGGGTGGVGGNSVYGGAGGGGGDIGAIAGGVSLYGGNGGAGGDNSPTPTAGSVPGGGGGASYHISTPSGAGGAGRVIVYELY